MSRVSNVQAVPSVEPSEAWHARACCAGWGRSRRRLWMRSSARSRWSSAWSPSAGTHSRLTARRLTPPPQIARHGYASSAMRLATFLPPDSSVSRAGEVRGVRVIAFADESITVLDRLCDPTGPAADGRSFALAKVALLAPVPQPRAIFGIGLNYADHVAE